MARAGFYEIRGSKIRFGRDGRWYADGEPITHSRITGLFSRHLIRKPDGTYWIEVGPDRAPVEVEDTPFVVQHVSRGAGGYEIELNDGTREPLKIETLEVAADHVMYCRVKGGSERARFLRAAYYDITPFIDEPEKGRFVLRDGDQTMLISRA